MCCSAPSVFWAGMNMCACCTAGLYSSSPGCVAAKTSSYCFSRPGRFFLQANRKSIGREFFKRTANTIDRNRSSAAGVADRRARGHFSPGGGSRTAAGNRVVKRTAELEGHSVGLRLKFQIHLQVFVSLRRHFAVLHVANQLWFQSAIGRLIVFGRFR